MPAGKPNKEDLRQRREQKNQMLRALAELEQHLSGEAQNGETPDIDLQPRNEAPPPPEPERSARNPYGFHDILTFAEHPYFLGETLTPVQKIILTSFFKGTPGNQDLKLDDHDDGGCSHCVWNYAREFEEEISKIILPEDVFTRPNSKLPVSNIPCYDCTRMDCALRSLRFNQLREEAPTDQVAIDLTHRESKPVTDKFQNQWMLIDDEQMDAPVRNQIKDKLLSNKKLTELILVLGRGAGKSYMVSVIALYMTYQLLRMGHPQQHWGLMDDAITILNVANSESQAKAVFRKIFQLAANSPYFIPFICHSTLTELHLMTPHDLKVYEERVRDGFDKKIGTVVMQSGTSNSATQVGGNVYCLIIDEMAEMSEGNGADLAEELYSKLSPALSRFRGDGRIVCISNPLYEHGKFYELYQQSFVNQNMLMFRCPTKFVNPNVTPEYLEAERTKDEAVFTMQFLAQFRGSARDPFIPEQYVDAAFSKLGNYTRTEKGNAAFMYYAHLDPAHNSDMYALAIVHSEQTHERDATGRPMRRVTVDHINLWKPDEMKNPINVDAVNDYVIDICNRFQIVQVSYDHWNSDGSITFLRSKGVNAIRRQFSPQYQDMIFENLRDLFLNQMIDFYGGDTHYSTSKEFVNMAEITEAKRQFKMLQRVIKHNRPKIEVPEGAGVNDDISDCVAAAAFECLNSQHFRRLPRARVVRMGRWF